MEDLGRVDSILNVKFLAIFLRKVLMSRNFSIANVELQRTTSMERGDTRRDGRGSLHYSSRESYVETEAKRTRHSSLKKSVHKKHSRQHHHPRYSSASDADAKRASYEENPHNWSECDSSQGRKYWFNTRTEKSQWEVPKAILLKRGREKETNSRSSRDHFSPSNSDRRRGQQNSHFSDHHFNSPLERDEEMDTSLPLLSSNSNNSPANVPGPGSQNLITSLHPLQQALLVKNQLEHSTPPSNNSFKQSTLSSPSLSFRSTESSISLPNPTNSTNSFDNIPSFPPLGRNDIRPHGYVKYSTNKGGTDGQHKLHNTFSSNLEKFANTPGIRIRKKPTISTSSESSFKFSTNCTITPIDIAIPESSTELSHDADLMNPSLIYPFTSPDLDYSEKELNQKVSERMTTSYTDHIDSQLRLTQAKLNSDIDNFSSQLCSLRASSLASLIESNQLSNS